MAGNKIGEAYVQLGLDNEPLDKQINETAKKAADLQSKLDKIPELSSKLDEINNKLKEGLSRALDVKGRFDSLFDSMQKLDDKHPLTTMLSLGQSITGVTALIPGLSQISALANTAMGIARALATALEEDTEHADLLLEKLAAIAQRKQAVAGAVGAAVQGARAAGFQIFPGGLPEQLPPAAAGRAAIQAGYDEITKLVAEMNSPEHLDVLRKQSLVLAEKSLKGNIFYENSANPAFKQAQLENRAQTELLTLRADDQDKIDLLVADLRNALSELKEQGRNRKNVDALDKEAGARVRNMSNKEALRQIDKARDETIAENPERFKKAIDKENQDIYREKILGPILNRASGALGNDLAMQVIINELVNKGGAEALGIRSSRATSIVGMKTPAEQDVPQRAAFQSQRFGIGELNNQLQGALFSGVAAEEAERKRKEKVAQDKINSVKELVDALKPIIDEINANTKKKIQAGVFQ